MASKDDSIISNTISSSTLERTFAHQFLTSLKKLRTNNPPNTRTTRRRRRSVRIKLAANSSMARAVGSRRVWSRALLSRNIRTRGRPINTPHSRRKKSPRSRVEKLRKLVPGGTSMGMGKLLEETGHYVQCLAVQVRVMQTIADHYSGLSN